MRTRLIAGASLLLIASIAGFLLLRPTPELNHPVSTPETAGLAARPVAPPVDEPTPALATPPSAAQPKVRIEVQVAPPEPMPAPALTAAPEPAPTREPVKKPRVRERRAPVKPSAGEGARNDDSLPSGMTPDW